MSEQLDNPPAFPCDWVDFQPTTGEQVIRQQFGGMTLRDYFAAKAMAAMMSPEDAGSLGDNGRIAASSYAYADAMLKERQSK